MTRMLAESQGIILFARSVRPNWKNRKNPRPFPLTVREEPEGGVNAGGASSPRVTGKSFAEDAESGPREREKRRGNGKRESKCLRVDV